ncbi:TetR/AcrR family transcriptional regulator [Tatumella terrea]|uniref:TetR/AcrR family transcriptional regulator n=1 Tax=Tatumella terrea TaxID=419007 RepID=A0ABW1VVZ1_9GAMM
MDTAMRLFWRYGYEGVSFQQLTATLGVAAPSLYAAFGNKAALYREALDRYEELRGTTDLSFMDKAVSMRDAIYLLLDGTARGLLDPEGEIGCMLNTGMISSHPDNTDLAKELVQRRYEFRCLLRDKLLNRVSRQEAERLSIFITVVMQGLAIQAHDGYTLTELQEAVGVALEAIPAGPTII